MTVIRELNELSKIIYTKPYDELSDYLKGIRDMINLINNEELLLDYVKAEMERDKNAKPVKTIKLQKFDEHFEDFYDSTQKVFVVYVGDRGFGGSIDPEIKIEDYDGVVWDCYLKSVMYIPSMDTYEVYYKPYEE